MKKILIADDEPNIVMTIDFLMRKQGFETFLALDGQEAIDMANKVVPDLAILDVMMPQFDGFQVCQYIKNSEALQHCKVIFLTAKAKDTDIAHGLSIGASLYLPKPFSTREFVEKVKLLLV
jgi:DNA-binding response OmpR family regulator